jgi:hypothetical protein
MSKNTKAAGVVKHGTGTQKQSYSSACGAVNQRGGGVIGQGKGRAPSGMTQHGVEGQPLATKGMGAGPAGKLPRAT